MMWTKKLKLGADVGFIKKNMFATFHLISYHGSIVLHLTIGIFLILFKLEVLKLEIPKFNQLFILKILTFWYQTKLYLIFRSCVIVSI